MTLYGTDELSARVARGANWLDENRPGWWERVDLDRLRMRNCCVCVLGQEYGDYYKAPITADTAVDLGFDVYFDDDDDDPDPDRQFADLDTAWSNLIEARRDAAGDSTAGILRDKTADTHMRNFALDIRNALNPPRRR